MLLKNNEGILPISMTSRNILIIGPFSKTQELLGNWQCKGSFEDVISLESGMKAVDHTLKIGAYEHFEDCPQTELQQCDHIIVAIGENWMLSGEGHSSVNLELEENRDFL